MSFCPQCGRGHGNGGEVCARCEELERRWEAGEIDDHGREVEIDDQPHDSPFLPGTTTGCGVGLTGHKMLYSLPQMSGTVTGERA